MASSRYLETSWLGASRLCFLVAGFDHKDVDARHKAGIVGDGLCNITQSVANWRHFAAVHARQFFASVVAIECFPPTKNPLGLARDRRARLLRQPSHQGEVWRPLTSRPPAPFARGLPESPLSFDRAAPLHEPSPIGLRRHCTDIFIKARMPNRIRPSAK